MRTRNASISAFRRGSPLLPERFDVLVVRARRLAWEILVVVSLHACGPGFVDQPTKVRFDPGGGGFWSLPLPSDLRRLQDGSLGLERWPGASENDLVGRWLEAADERLDGWGVTSGIVVPLTGPVRPDSLPATAAASTSRDASVFLMDIDPASPERGRRLPVEVSFRARGDRWAPDNLLAAVPAPGSVRRPGTLYALVVTDGVRDADRARLGRSRAFHDAYEAGADGDDPAARSLAPLRAALAEDGVELGRVVGAAVFRTLDPRAAMRRLARWADGLQALAGGWEVAQSYASYQVLTATYDVPVIQSGQPPYAGPGEGRIVWGPDGDPVVQGTRAARLAVTVPRRPQPTAGFPLTLYLHGWGGDWYEAIDRGPRPELPPEEAAPPEPGAGPAEWLARRGVATAAIDLPLHGDRASPPDTSGPLFHGLAGNVEAAIDTSQAAVMELVLLSRLLLDVEIDPTLAPTLDAGDAPGGSIRFDPERLTAMGQSMGATIAVPWATVDPRVRGLVLSGVGGGLPEIVVGAHEPLDLEPLVEAALDMGAGELDRGHPLLHAMQSLWDLVDPVAVAGAVSARPRDELAARDVMMTAGVRDGCFAPRAEAALAGALGLTLAGPEIEPILPEALRLGGRDTAAFPLGGNLNGHTAGVVQYAAPHELGHEVVFNQEAARYQYTCFLASVGSAAGASIPAPGTDGEACPGAGAP